MPIHNRVYVDAEGLDKPRRVREPRAVEDIARNADTAPENRARQIGKVSNVPFAYRAEDGDWKPLFTGGISTGTRGRPSTLRVLEKAMHDELAAECEAQRTVQLADGTIITRAEWLQQKADRAATLAKVGGIVSAKVEGEMAK